MQTSIVKQLARVPWFVAIVVALAVGGAVLATAWISDDALVTFRTVENLVAGDGMRWNVLDRTQTATHPLWILLLAAARWCTGELYFTAIGLGVMLSAIAGLLLARATRHGWPSVAVVLLATLGSRSFVEFGTCGLENALVYALVAAFAHVWFVREPGAKRLRRLGVLGALLALARQDLVLLVAPCVLAACRGTNWRTALRGLLPGILLGGAWYGFALVYYGTVIPTPGYGKVVSADVPQSALFGQGAWYLLDLCLRDPVAAIVLLGAIVAGCAVRQVLFVAPAIGVLLQVLYTLRVGGDFMSGRFFTAAFVLAVVVVARGLHAAKGHYVTVVLAVAMFATGLPPWLRGTPTKADVHIWHGIGNERAYYAEQLGLWSPQRFPIRYAMFATMFAGRPRPVVLLAHAAGVPGYLNGAAAHIVDPFLCDPLLMRLPLQDPTSWRIGHFKRRVPEGYLETLASGENRLRNASLAKYWDALQVLLRAPVWSNERWRVWWQFLLGDYEDLLRDYVREVYHNPPRVEVEEASLPQGLAPRAHWYDCDAVVVREGGLRVRCAGAKVGKKLRLLVDGGGAGELLFQLQGREVARLPFAVPVDLNSGARWFEFVLPEAATAGCDAVDVMLRPVSGEDAQLTLLEVFAVLGLQIAN